MEYSKVVAILNISDYGLLSEALKSSNIPGVTVSRVEGYGDYVNDFAAFGFSENMKIEIYTDSEQAEAIAQQLSELANAMTEGGGVIAIEPVSTLLNVRKLST
jgi:nitrogen regulatory protein P-II 1